jgi:hypothetical protein
VWSSIAGNEQTPKDNYQTALFDGAFFTNANCPGGVISPSTGRGSFCQIMGPFEMPLNEYNTVPLYGGMNSRCPSQVQSECSFSVCVVMPIHTPAPSPPVHCSGRATFAAQRGIPRAASELLASIQHALRVSRLRCFARQQPRHCCLVSPLLTRQ